MIAVSMEGRGDMLVALCLMLIAKFLLQTKNFE